MKKTMLNAGRIITLVLGIIGVVLTLALIFIPPRPPIDTAIVVLCMLGIPSVLLIVSYTRLRNKIIIEFPKTQAEMDAKEHLKNSKKVAKHEYKDRKKEAAKRKKEEKEQAEREKEIAGQKEVERIRNNIYEVPHLAGLPLVENAKCDICYGDDEFVIAGGGNTFRLPFQKVTDICIKTDEEIQKQYVSSVGGAVGGYMLFGGIGAAIGGRAKEKSITVTTHYLIITYINNDEISYIGFEVEKQLSRAAEWVSRFEPQSRHAGKDIIL